MRRSLLFILIIPLVSLVSGMLPKPEKPNTLLVDCPAPITLKEGAKFDTSVTGAPKVTSNNGGAVTISWIEIYQKGDCKNKADMVTRIFTITNAIGEQVRCNQIITLKHLTLNEVYFPSDTTIDYPDSLSTLTQKLLSSIPKTLGTLKLSYVDNRASQNCNIPVRIRRIWTLEDICSGQTRTATTFMNVHRYYNHFKQIIKKPEAICTDEGYVDLTPVGEFGPYLYRWSTGDSINYISNKEAGNYSLTITDRFGCTISEVYSIQSMSQKADIGGRIITDTGIRVVPDSIRFENETLISKYCISQNSGLHYGFTLKSKKAGNYNYNFVKHTGVRDGISTKDIVMIQRHILGISKFTDTLQNIAADVNYNFNITASDITELRRLLLGISNKFNVVKPWYFLRKDWRTIAKPNKPIADIEFKGFNVPNLPLTNVDVFALKMGDIDASYNGISGQNISARSVSKDVVLQIGANRFDQDAWTPVYLKAMQPIAGLQFKLNCPSIEAFVIKYHQLNESFIHTSGNTLTVSWSTGQTLNWNPELPLFYIKCNEVSHLEKDQDLTAEWYDVNLNEFDLYIESGDEKYRNNGVTQWLAPNPAKDLIRYVNSFDRMEVSIYSIAGTMLLQKILQDNQPLDLKSLANGVYFIRSRKSNGDTRTEMIILEK